MNAGQAMKKENTENPKTKPLNNRFMVIKKLMSAADFVILNEHKKDLFKVEGESLKMVRSFKMTDAKSGEEAAAIVQTGMMFKPTFNVVREGQMSTSIARRPVSLKSVIFDMKTPNQMPMEIRADVLENKYTFYRGEDVVARCYVQHLTLTRTYKVEIGEDEDNLMILGAVVAIAQMR